MGSRVLKKIDYQELVIMIYKYSNYQKERAVILYKYNAVMLSKNRFNEIYIDKLSIDTNLTDYTLKSITTRDINISRQLEKYFSYYETVAIKSMVFDITHKGYYE